MTRANLCAMAILLMLAAGLAFACASGNGVTYYPPAHTMGPLENACRALYDKMYGDCGLSFQDNNSVKIPEDRVLIACAQDQAGYGPGGAYAQCIENDANDCPAMASCLAQAINGV